MCVWVSFMDFEFFISTLRGLDPILFIFVGFSCCDVIFLVHVHFGEFLRGNCEDNLALPSRSACVNCFQGDRHSNYRPVQMVH